MRIDLTAERLYTLARNTQAMLGDLERDVTLKFYFSRSSEGTPIPIKQYAQRIQDLLGEYETHGRGKVRLEVFDPEPDSDEEEWAQKYGLSPQGMGLFGGEGFYLGRGRGVGHPRGGHPLPGPQRRAAARVPGDPARLRSGPDGAPHHRHPDRPAGHGHPADAVPPAAGAAGGPVG